MGKWTPVAAERQRRYRAARREHIRALGRRLYYKHREKRLVQARRYKSLNKDEMRAYQRSWCLQRREHIRSYVRSRYSTNPQVMLRNRLSSRIHKLLRAAKGQKSNPTLCLLGLSLLDFRRYLEHLFLPGMSWQNFGQWHIDHIKPCASFDLTDSLQQRQCFRYTNLRPLWAKENLSKGAKYDAQPIKDMV